MISADTRSDASFIVPFGQIGAQATTAILALWDTDNGTFWRSTDHKVREAGTKPARFYPTVTFRCVSALIRAYRYRPELLNKDVLASLREEMIPAVTRRSISALSKSTLNVPGEASGNPFTLALCVETLEAIIDTGDLAAQTVRKKAETRLREAAEHLRELARRAVVDADTHPFVLFHVTRGLRAASRVNPRATSSLPICAELTHGVRVAAERLLAREAAGSLVPSEAIALMFAAATLAESADPDDHNYVYPCLQVSLRAQDPNGCWPLGRVVRDDRSGGNARLEIVTHEVAWALADTILILSDKDARSLSDDFRSGLGRSIDYTTRSQIRVSAGNESIKGWSSDVLYAEPMVESWTSAIVLEATIAISLVADLYNHKRALATFSTINPQDATWPRWLRWSRYVTDGEPDSAAPILAYLQSHLIDPIKSSRTRLPSPESRTMSVLLFGPPGTSKTTVVKAMADALGWPVVFLSPGTFIERGLEFIEASARDVFQRILMLQRCVVMFDECDELFRDRGPSRQSEQLRTITAFVTASMLPKLQDLHDRGKVVFFICTNHLGSLDPAVKRNGRIDHILAVGPPDEIARRRVVETVLATRRSAPEFEAAVTEIVKATDGFTRDELIRLCELVHPPFRPLPLLRSVVTALVESFSSGRSITKDDFDQFLVDRGRYSYAVLEAKNE